MITLPVSNFKQISQDIYDQTVLDLQLHQLTCPSCRHSACLTIHGYYTRCIHTADGLIRLRILRVRCSLTPEALYKEILDEYLLTYISLTDKLERLDKRIEELASQEEYRQSVKKLCCFIGIKTHTALAVLVEVGDFKRFVRAEHFASYLGITPGEYSSGEDEKRLSITKAGNRHVRMLLTETAQCYTRGAIGFKSKDLKSRQDGNEASVIAYADKANERLRRRYYRMVLGKNKNRNVAKTAVARELACFLWGMMTDHIA